MGRLFWTPAVAGDALVEDVLLAMEAREEADHEFASILAACFGVKLPPRRKDKPKPKPTAAEIRMWAAEHNARRSAMGKTPRQGSSQKGKRRGTLPPAKPEERRK